MATKGHAMGIVSSGEANIVSINQPFFVSAPRLAVVSRSEKPGGCF